MVIRKCPKSKLDIQTRSQKLLFSINLWGFFHFHFYAFKWHESNPKLLAVKDLINSPIQGIPIKVPNFFQGKSWTLLEKWLCHWIKRPHNTVPLLFTHPLHTEGQIYMVCKKNYFWKTALFRLFLSFWMKCLFVKVVAKLYAYLATFFWKIGFCPKQVERPDNSHFRKIIVSEYPLVS